MYVDIYFSIRSSFIKIRLEALSTLLKLLDNYHAILTRFISPHTVHKIRASTHSLDLRRTSVQDIVNVDTLVSSIVWRIENSPNKVADWVNYQIQLLDLCQLTCDYDENTIQYFIESERYGNSRTYLDVFPDISLI